MKNVYLDNNATTQVAPEVAQAMQPFFGELWGNPSSMHTFGGQVSRHIEKARQQAANLWGILDGHLAGRDYLTGDAPTMGDIPAGAAVYRWFTMDLDRPEAPNLRAWYDRLNARPPYRQHVMLPLT